MANLPDGISTLGPVYIPTKVKTAYVKACNDEGILMSDGIKEDVMARIKRNDPDFSGV